MRELKFAAVAAALMLQGCMTATYVLARPSGAVLADMARRCSQDAGLRWFGPRPRGIEVWELGTLTREPRSGEKLDDIQAMQNGANAYDLLTSGLASAVYANLRPAYGDGVSSPPPGSPAGIYRFELRPWSDPGCAKAKTALSGAKGPTGVSDDRCMTYKYVGPFDGQPRPNMILNFIELGASDGGFDRIGEVLFVDGAVRASSVRYSAQKSGVSGEYSGTWGVRACERVDKRSIYEALRGVHPY